MGEGDETPLPDDPALWEAFALRRSGRLARDELRRRAEQAARLRSPLTFAQTGGPGVTRSEVGFRDDQDEPPPPPSS